MDKYVGLLTIAILSVSFYIIYSRYTVYKNKKDIISLIVLGGVFLLQVQNIKYGELSFEYTLAQILLLFVLYSNFNENKLIVLSLAMLLVIFKKIDGIYANLVDVISICIMFYAYLGLIKTKKIKGCKMVLVLLIIFSQLIYIKDKNLLLISNIVSFIVCTNIFIDITKTCILKQVEKTTKKKNKYIQGKLDIDEYIQKLKLNNNKTKKIEKDIQKKQRLLENILDKKESCMFIVDSNDFILSKDEKFEKIWDKYKDYKGVLNIVDFSIDNIKDENQFVNDIKKARRYKMDIESEIKGKDNRFFRFNYSTFELDNKQVGILCSVIDITYDTKNKIKIEENNIKYEKIVETIPYNILLTEKNNIIYSNNKSSNVDFSESQMKNIILEESIKGEVCYNLGKTKNFINISRTSFNENENQKNIVVIKDITEYKKSVKKLKISKEKYKSLVNLMPEGIYLSDYENGELMYSNEAFSKILKKVKIKEKELVKNVDLSIDTRKHNNEVVFERKDVNMGKDKNINLEIGKRIIKVNNKIKEVGIVRDITESVQIENIEREIESRKIANKIKTEFFINMSHELKTPLNVISSSVQLLESINKEKIEKEPSGQLSTNIATIKKNSYMLMNLINNVIDLAKLESKFHEHNANYYNVVTLVEEICEEFNKHLHLNGVTIVFDTTEEEIVSRVDDDDIEKVILTLLSIVIRYSYSNSTVYVKIDKNEDKIKITLENSKGHNHYKYINDKDKVAIEIGLKVTENIINLYNGDISIDIGHENGIEINLELECSNMVYDYKERKNKKSENFIYTEYLRMCNF